MEFRSFVYFYLDKNILPSICCSIKILWDIHNMLFSNPNQMFGILTYSRIIEKNYLTPLSLRNYRCEYFQEQFTPQWGGGGLILKIWEKNKKWTSRARGKFFIFFFFLPKFSVSFHTYLINRMRGDIFKKIYTPGKLPKIWRHLVINLCKHLSPARLQLLLSSGKCLQYLNNIKH